ncbi:MAG: hypothetical protein WCP69_03010 [Bacteroidota bacterium]
MKRFVLTFISLVFIVLFVGLSCKKEDADNIIIKGTVINPNTGSPIAGAYVYVDGSILSSGVYNENFTEIASGVTDASGQFEIKTAWQVVSRYRLRSFKTNYFDYTSILEAEAIPKGGTYNAAITILPAAWVRLNVTNIIGFDNNDQIQYKFASTPQSCTDCCSSQFMVGNGASYRASTKCRVIGNSYNKFYWTVLRNGIINPFADSVYCTAFDTAVLNINY